MEKRVIQKKVTVFDKRWKEVIKEIKKLEDDVLLDFCMKICKGECCNMEHKGLSEEQVRLIFSLSEKGSLYNRRNRYGESVIRKNKDGTFYSNLCHGLWCPSFDSNKRICNIHSSLLRPDYCINFPFYFTDEDGMQVLEIFDCPGTRKVNLDKVLKTAASQKIWTRCIFPI